MYLLIEYYLLLYILLQDLLSLPLEPGIIYLSILLTLCTYL